jgi:hypothetical protein
MAAAATVTAALVAGAVAGAAPPQSSDEVVALVHAWPKKYTGVGLVAEPPAETVTTG